MAMPKMPPATPFAWAWNLTVTFYIIADPPAASAAPVLAAMGAGLIAVELEAILGVLLSDGQAIDDSRRDRLLLGVVGHMMEGSLMAFFSLIRVVEKDGAFSRR